MDAATIVVLGIVAFTATALFLELRRSVLLPRSRRKKLASHLIEQLSLTEIGRERDHVVLGGRLDGWPVKVNIGPSAQAVVLARLPDDAMPCELYIDETSGWAYQKMENRVLGLTRDTGDVEYDRFFDVGPGPDAPDRLPEHVRRSLVGHRRPGLQLKSDWIIIGNGTSTPFGYFGSPDETSEGIERMLRDAVNLAQTLRNTSAKP